jgi:hypothetical protein
MSIIGDPTLGLQGSCPATRTTADQNGKSSVDMTHSHPVKGKVFDRISSLGYQVTAFKIEIRG